jgi:hypothetical protein
VLACAAALSFAAPVLAAHPKRSARFHGAFTKVGINGFKVPVSFAVSVNGRALVSFTYSTLGCFGAGGFRPGVDYYSKPSAIIRVGTVRVSSAGRFSASGVKSTYKAFGVTTTTTTTLSGKFTSARAATGSIRISQTLTGATRGTCSSIASKFTARA